MNFELHFPELDQSSGSNLGSELNTGSTNYKIPQHSPVHDLESCLWVSMWVAVHIILDGMTKVHSGCQAEDEHVLRKLMPEHSNMDMIGSAKKDLLPYMDIQLSKSFTPFRTILLELASMANTYYKQSVAKQWEGQQFTTEEIEKLFAAYMKIFEEHMPQQETWDHVFAHINITYSGL